MSENSQPRSIIWFPRFIQNLKYGYVTLLAVERGLCDMWNLSIYFPKITYGVSSESEWFSDEVSHDWSVSFPTKIKLGTAPYYWGFTIKLLGFGVSLSHQYGY